MSTGSTVVFPTSTGTSFGEHCEHCAFGHPWALPGGALEAQSLSNGGASGPSSVEQYKHKACASGASRSFRELPGSFRELCGVQAQCLSNGGASGPSAVEQCKHKAFASGASGSSRELPGSFWGKRESVGGVCIFVSVQRKRKLKLAADRPRSAERGVEKERGTE